MGRQRVDLTALGALDRAGFVAVLGGIFEHSPWVAEGAFDARPFRDLGALHAAMVAVVRGAGRERQLALVRAHPQLAGREAAAGTLTSDSSAEQASAGLDRCTPEELVALRERNAAYLERFGFPFVMAVKGRSRHEILAAMVARLGNDGEAEIDRCLEEIAQIARRRLEALLGGEAAR
jgi:2-oxo-4-hydroxy-4-carboxy-5-ureidoimidazoline decarboxylase